MVSFAAASAAPLGRRRTGSYRLAVHPCRLRPPTWAASSCSAPCHSKTVEARLVHQGVLPLVTASSTPGPTGYTYFATSLASGAAFLCLPFDDLYRHGWIMALWIGGYMSAAW